MDYIPKGEVIRIKEEEKIDKIMFAYIVVVVCCIAMAITVTIGTIQCRREINNSNLNEIAEREINNVKG